MVRAWAWERLPPPTHRPEVVLSSGVPAWGWARLDGVEHMAGSAVAVSDNGEEAPRRSILQSVGRRLHEAFSSRDAALSCLGLALFYGWTLIGVYGVPPLRMPQADAAAFMFDTVRSAACGVGACLVIGLLLWRARRYEAMAFGCALASAVAAVCCVALAAFFPEGSATAYTIVTRLAAPVVAVGWGAVFSRMPPYPATLAVLFACLGGFLLLAAEWAAPAPLGTVLVIALLPASAALMLGVRKCCGDSARFGMRGAADGSGCGGRHDAAEGRPAFRAFLLLVWRVMLVFALFGVATWVGIVAVNMDKPAGGLVPLVAAGGAAAVGGLLAFALLSGDSLAQIGIYRLGLPLVMAGTLLFASRDVGQVFGVSLMSVGYTCFDMLCFMLYAAACRRCGAQPLRAFALCMGVESGVPAVSVVLSAAIGLPGGTDPADGFPVGQVVTLVIGLACIVALLSASVFGEVAGLVGRRRPEAPDPSDASRALDGAVEFAAKCIDAVSRFSLSPREAEVLMLLARGRNVPFIAGRLGISRTTVKTHIEHVYRKLGVSERQEMLDVIEGLPVS